MLLFPILRNRFSRIAAVGSILCIERYIGGPKSVMWNRYSSEEQIISEDQ